MRIFPQSSLLQLLVIVLSTLSGVRTLICSSDTRTGEDVKILNAMCGNNSVKYAWIAFFNVEVDIVIKCFNITNNTGTIESQPLAYHVTGMEVKVQTQIIPILEGTVHCDIVACYEDNSYDIWATVPTKVTCVLPKPMSTNYSTTSSVGVAVSGSLSSSLILSYTPPDTGGGATESLPNNENMIFRIILIPVISILMLILVTVLNFCLVLHRKKRQKRSHQAGTDITI